MTLSTREIDKLGARLKVALTVEDLKLLDQFRREFREDYDLVVATIRNEFGLVTSGRPAKTEKAIVNKLKRSSMRLSQMQDIAGCRVLLESVDAQDQVVAKLMRVFPASLHDRRLKPSHGYRAVHIIARPKKLPIEIQIRTELQHYWAELSEKCSDLFGIDLKYGGGPEDIRQLLADTSKLAAEFERCESELLQVHGLSTLELTRLTAVRNEVKSEFQLMLLTLGDWDDFSN